MIKKNSTNLLTSNVLHNFGSVIISKNWQKCLNNDFWLHVIFALVLINIHKIDIKK